MNASQYMSNVQCRDGKAEWKGRLFVVDVDDVVRWYSEAHWVFDRLTDKRNDYRMVVMMSCEDLGGRRR
jgi:hypothetical protein